MCSTIWAHNFVTMATYWVPDLSNVKCISGHLWRSIFIFANDASYTWSNKHINMLAWVWGLFDVFRAENHLHIEIKWVETRKEWVAIGTKRFIAIGVCSVELSAYRVSMVCAANWPRQLYLYTWCNIGLCVEHHQSSSLHILHIFQTFKISPELMQVFATWTVNGVFILEEMAQVVSK